MVAVIAVYDVKFNHRHEYTPLQRFTSEYVDKDLIIGLKKRTECLKQSVPFIGVSI